MAFLFITAASLLYALSLLVFTIVICCRRRKTEYNWDISPRTRRSLPSLQQIKERCGLSSRVTNVQMNDLPGAVATPELPAPTHLVPGQGDAAGRHPDTQNMSHQSPPQPSASTGYVPPWAGYRPNGGDVDKSEDTQIPQDTYEVPNDLQEEGQGLSKDPGVSVPVSRPLPPPIGSVLYNPQTNKITFSSSSIQNMNYYDPPAD